MYEELFVLEKQELLLVNTYEDWFRYTLYGVQTHIMDGMMDLDFILDNYVCSVLPYENGWHEVMINHAKDRGKIIQLVYRED